MDINKNLTALILGIPSKTKRKIIAVCGAADLGKSYLSKQLATELTMRGLSAAHLEIDSYLIPRAKRLEIGISGYDINAYDLQALRNHLLAFLKGASFEFNEYDHSSGIANGSLVKVCESDYLILDGLHSMHSSFNDLIYYSIFIYTSDQLLKEIRHQADITKRKQSVKQSLAHLEIEFNLYKKHVEPNKYKADKLIELSKKWLYIERS